MTDVVDGRAGGFGHLDLMVKALSRPAAGYSQPTAEPA
jgi:hypothetical protein